MLAGPLLRRAEPGGLTFWLIASRVLELSLVLESPQAGQQRRIRLEGEACQRLRLGHHAVLHLIRFTPDAALPGDCLIEYDLLLHEGDRKSVV